MHISHRHRRAGAISALFVVLIAASGLALNHTERLGLDSRYVRLDAVLGWYNIGPPAHAVAAQVGSRWLTQLGKRLYVDDQAALALDAALVGAVSLGDQMLVAAGGEILMLTADGVLTEKLDALDGIPAGLNAIGITNHAELALRAPDGVEILSPVTLERRPAGGDEAIRWSELSPPPADLNERLDKLYRGSGLTLERVLLDVHSGRILGTLGVVLVDLAALFFLFLALSGLWMWFRPLHRPRHHSSDEASSS